MSNVTNSTLDDSESLDPLTVSYICVGMGAVTTNSLIFIILLSDRALLKQSAMIAGFAFSHFLCGSNIGTAGIVRVVNRAVATQPIPAWSCVQSLYPLAYPLAFQSTALLLCLVGIERVTAVAAPHWFRNWFSHKRMWYMVGIIFGLVAVSAGVAAGLSYDRVATRQCSQPNVFGTPYTSFTRLSSAIGGTTAIVLNLSSMIIGEKRARKLPLSSGEAGKMRKQMQLTKSMLTLSTLDFCLVVIPNVISFVSVTWGVSLPSFLGSVQANVAFCVNAMSAIFAYLAFNSQFRHAAARLFRIPDNSVAPK